MTTAREAVSRFDAAVDRAFDRLRGNASADRAMYVVTDLGDFSHIWLLIGAAKALTSERQERAFLRLVVCLGAESLLVNQGIKRLFRRVRPEILEPHPLHRLRTPRTTSFPSGHASSGMLAAALLSDDVPAAAPLWYALGAVVAGSRVHVRIHHGSDVVGGAVVGVALGVVAKRLWPLA